VTLASNQIVLDKKNVKLYKFCPSIYYTADASFSSQRVFFSFDNSDSTAVATESITFTLPNAYNINNAGN
jgi:hypothetical protein